jgi:hypothetical protein
LQKLLDGEALAGELSLIRKFDNKGGHRSGFDSRDGGSGNRYHYQTMVVISSWLPRDSVKKPTTCGPGRARCRAAGLDLLLSVRRPRRGRQERL